MSDMQILEGIPPDNVKNEYQNRDLVHLTDSGLFSAAISSGTALVALRQREVADSAVGSDLARCE
jgi:hypothetical protein